MTALPPAVVSPPVRRRRLALAAACVAVTTVACGGDVALQQPVDAAAAAAPVSAPAPVIAPREPDLSGLADALASVATAFRSADPEAIRPWLDDADSEFGRRWLQRAADLAGVRFSDYRLELDPRLPDLATAAVRARLGEDAHVVYVRESHALEGFDADGPSTDDLYLTVVRRPDGWRIASDSDAESLGLVSVDHLWDHGPVVVGGGAGSPLIALHHPEEADEVPALIAEAAAALEDVVERWPLVWSGAVPLIVPRDEEELAELLHVTFDLTNFIAFATATPRGELGDFVLGGSRIVLNSERFFGRDTTTRQLVLAHELLHVATRPSAGPWVPAWVEEGVAQALGEQRSTTGTDLLDALVARGEVPTLPTDSDFTTGGRDRIFLSYQLAWSFVDHLVREFGDDAVGRFYAALGRGAVGAPGTEQWHVDRAAREVFGSGIDELEAAWASAVTTA